MESKIKIYKFLRIVLVVVFLMPFFTQISTIKASSNYSELSDQAKTLWIPNSCTIFTVNINDTVYFGNNEDYLLPNTYMRLYPPQDILTLSGRIDTYGVVSFGFNHNGDPADGYPQGGMNDQGLCLDGNGLPSVPMNSYPGRERLFITALMQILLECANVSEVINWFQTHYLGSTWNSQIHFADANGDAIVVSVSDREFVFTNKSSIHYLVSTNFNLADYSNGYYPCSRYNTATNMLGQITTEEDLTVDACRDVLDAVHIEGQYATKYSNIFDPINQKIHIYYERNFNQRVSLNLGSELASVQRGGTDVFEENQLYFKEISIASLFAEDPLVPGYPLLIFISIIALVSSIFTLSKRKLLKKNRDS